MSANLEKFKRARMKLVAKYYVNKALVDARELVKSSVVLPTNEVEPLLSIIKAWAKAMDKAMCQDIEAIKPKELAPKPSPCNLVV